MAAGMGAVWLLDTLANWSVKSRANRADQEIELPPARNLFTQEPRHWSKALLDVLLATAAGPTPEQKALRARFMAVYLSETVEPDQSVTQRSASPSGPSPFRLTPQAPAWKVGGARTGLPGGMLMLADRG